MTNIKNNTVLPWTGERYVPEIRGTIALEHLHRYAFASEHVAGKVVLDIASGEGYGSEMLSRTAKQVYGVDIDEASVKHAQQKYKADNLEYVLGSCTDIPFGNESVDIVVSFETIEHITEHDKMMLEIKRILRPGGMLIISSPERHEYSEVNKQQNPYHLKELSHDEFISLLGKNFRHTSCFGQRLIYGSALVENGKPRGGVKTYQFDRLPQHIEAENGLTHSIYLIGVCSDHAIQVTSGSICEQDINQSETVLAYQQIVTEKEGVIAEMCREILALREAVGNRNDLISGLQPYIAEKENVIAQREPEFQHLRAYLDLLKSNCRGRITALLRAFQKKVNSVVNSMERYRMAAFIIWTHRKTGIFDPKWYLQSNPDVRDLNLNPWWHFAMYGVYEDRKPNNSFSVQEYISISDDVSLSKYNTTLHYVIYGWKECMEIRLHQFDKIFYKRLYPDVEKAGINAFRHYIKHGREEGRLNRRVLIEREEASFSISIVIPTYNRAHILRQMVESLIKCAKGLNFEIIIVNDGSTDQTKDVLLDLQKKYPQLIAINITNKGAGLARNHGVQAAKKDIILFIGDDIIPANNDFILAHVAYHQTKVQKNIAILGKVVLPQEDQFEISAVMKHIQGNGGEQFGYTDMQPYRFWDWRFFYTCNVSVKREVITDWMAEGFSAEFKGCGFEDGEFAYRMEKKYGNFPILYIEESLGYHHHSHNVESFLRRQRHVGAMGYTLFKLHSKTVEKTGFLGVLKKLNSSESNHPQIIPEYLERINELFKMAIDLEKNNLLGSETWHKELLHCIFKISACLGFIESAATPLCNYSEALKYAIDSAEESLKTPAMIHSRFSKK
jgi:glycosyltransferase involved in cell wall biosynthesis/SAM-dependent methyltransferase